MLGKSARLPFEASPGKRPIKPLARHFEIFHLPAPGCETEVAGRLEASKTICHSDLQVSNVGTGQALSRRDYRSGVCELNRKGDQYGAPAPCRGKNRVQ